jgi:uncharacterized cysteine cluster protein YcgN (CxxCxxCC family)
MKGLQRPSSRFYRQRKRISSRVVDAARPPQRPFWRDKPLDAMSEEEWESLCDGCGRCCLHKLEDWDTGKLYWTNVACRMLDPATGRCRDYANRFEHVPDCVRLDARTVAEIDWLPPTCAYRLVEEGKDLPAWHPLVTGDPRRVIEAGVSVAGRTISEEGMEPEDFEDHVVKWPGQKVARRRTLREG